MFESTKIVKKIDAEKLFKTIKRYPKENIGCTDHTFFRLSEKQRKIFTCRELREILLNNKPFLAGIQHNGNHALFYKYQNKNLKIVIHINNRKIKIVTFYFIQEWQIPKI